jgi:hypothetical protein
MAHDVIFNVPNRKLGKEDIRFDVHDDEGKVGTLLVSKGGVDWRPAHGKLAYRVRWERFGEIMTREIKGQRPVSAR